MKTVEKAKSFVILLIFIGCNTTGDKRDDTIHQSKESGSVKSFYLGNFIGRANPKNYSGYFDRIDDIPHEVITIKSLRGIENDYATIFQSAKAITSLGKRVQLTGYIKTSDVMGYAGLWMRVDPANYQSENQALAFDNMYNRPIIGTTDWKKYSVVLDIPRDAERIVFGALLYNSGQVWIDSLNIRIVDTSISTTDIIKTKELTL